MKMKNMRFLALAAIFTTGSIAPKPGVSHQGVVVIAGGLVGLILGASLGLQKGAALAKTYEESLPAEIAGALFGMSAGGAMGIVAGFVVAGITTETIKFMGKKIKRAKIKLEKMKQEYL